MNSILRHLYWHILHTGVTFKRSRKDVFMVDFFSYPISVNHLETAFVDGRSYGAFLNRYVISKGVSNGR